MTDDQSIVYQKTDNGGVIVCAGDSFAFSNRRFESGNKNVLQRIPSLYPKKIKAVRIVQRKRYMRSDGRAVFDTSHFALPAVQERDPAFAPSMSDSNDKRTYQMTQQFFFSMERYCTPPSERNSEYHNMMRGRTYDSFVQPNRDNPLSWHFTVTKREERLIKPEPHFSAPGYKTMRVSTMFQPGVPDQSALLAGISPESRTLDICVMQVGLKDLKEKELEARVRQHRDEIEKSKNEEQPKSDFGLFQIPQQKKESSSELQQKQSELKEKQSELAKEEAELRRIRALNGRPDIERLERVVPGIEISVYSDGLDNYRVESSPSISNLEGRAFVYTVAYRTDYLRSDSREFKQDLIPDNVTVSQWKEHNRKAGMEPCLVPQEIEALKRLAASKRHQWPVKAKSPAGVNHAFFPDIVANAINGQDVPVKELLLSLTGELTQYKDATIPLKDEFNTFTEAMVYWRSGVCRHRARTGFMILNSLGIPARLVVSRSHAFVEIFVPEGRTQVNFGGGFGDDTNELFPTITLPAGVGLGLPFLPGTVPAPPLSAPLGIPGFPAAALILCAICLLVLMHVIFSYVKNRARNGHDNRIPVSSLTDFMLSQSELLNHDLSRYDCRGAATAVLEAVMSRIPPESDAELMAACKKVKTMKTVSSREFRRIVNICIAKMDAMSEPGNKNR